MGKCRNKNKNCIGVAIILFSLFIIQSCGRKYDYVGDFQGGLSLVHSVKSNKYGAINNKKKEMIPCIYDTILLNGNYPIVMLNGKYGVVSFAGVEMVPCQYDSIYFDENFAIVKLNKKYGIFSGNKEIIPTKYGAFSFLKDKIIAELDGKKYNFDKNGNLLPNMLYIDIYREEDGKYPSYEKWMAYKILGLGLDEVYFIDADSKERLAYKEIIINGNTVVEAKSVYFMFDESPPVARFTFKDGKSCDWKVYGRNYQYTLKNNVLNIKE